MSIDMLLLTLSTAAVANSTAAETNELSIELLQYLSIGFFAVAAALFLVGIAMFFLLDIKKVIGDVSGSTARKAIEDIRQQNEVSGDKAYKPSPVNRARGKTTDKISQSGNLRPAPESSGVAVGTAKLKGKQITETNQAPAESQATTVLGQPQTSNETTVLDQTSAPQAANETTVLEQTAMPQSQAANETTVLNNAPVNTVIVKEYELGFCGSAEIIE